MGVGGDLITCILRSWALLDSVTGPPHPCLPGVQVPKVIFSDDGRAMALSPEEMVHILCELYKVAAVSGGILNASNLKMYHIRFTQGQASVQGGLHLVTIKPTVSRQSASRASSVSPQDLIFVL